MAYVPSEPERDGEDDWPPASRANAIEAARQARLEEGGRPVDDATIERVADAVMDPEYPVPGAYSTAEELAARITDDRAALQAAGFDLMEMGRERGSGVVRVAVVGGRDAALARTYFAGRYGDAVAVEWLGPSRYREVPHPFGSWASEGRTLRVFFGLDHNGQRRGEARVAEESGKRIVVALTRLQPVGYTTLIGGFERHHADLRLREPVGERAVIDASTGVARPSLAQLGNR